ncbi:hypothetical protein ILYODFUR_035213 [Ilyodon furcidens]|uniref:Uncharacterized protein n=1 Tax=Ilyodon furcidens TaxID=33524 RepID=A0ABV0UXU3_9TELE
MFATMLLMDVSLGKHASDTMLQFTQKSLLIYGLHNFSLDVRKILTPTIKKDVNHKKHASLMTLCTDMTEWYSRGQHIARYRSYAMRARMDRSLQAKQYNT